MRQPFGVQACFGKLLQLVGDFHELVGAFAGDLFGRFGRVEGLRVVEGPAQQLHAATIQDIIQGDAVDLLDRVVEIGMDENYLHIRGDQQGRVAKRIRVKQ